MNQIKKCSFVWVSSLSSISFGISLAHLGNRLPDVNILKRGNYIRNIFFTDILANLPDSIVFIVILAQRGIGFHLEIVTTDISQQ